MQSEQDWIGRVDEDENNGAAERYNYFMRPEPFEDLGPIRIIKDEWLGPKTKVREMQVGMTRNAAAENKKQVTVYLQPFPHIRIDKAKPLQGWYKSLYEPPGVRNRPCFTDAILTEPYGGYCLPPDSLVETPTGPKPIQELNIGDLVVGQSEGKLTVSVVERTVNRWTYKGLLLITTSDGEQLQLTEEHPVFSLDRNDYVKAGELYVNEKVEARTVQELRKTCNKLSKQHFPILSGLPISPLSNGCSCGWKERPSKSHLALYERELLSSLCYSTLKSLLGVSSEGSISEGVYEKGEIVSNQRDSENSRGSKETSGRSTRKEAFSINETEMCGISEGRDNRKELIREKQIRLSERENFQSSFQLGVIDSEVFGRTETGLGVRNRDHRTEEWGQIPSRLQIERENLYRSQGIYVSQGSVKDSTSKKVGEQSRGVRSKEVASARSSEITSIERLTTPLRVYDIQTSTANFYVRGLQGLKSFHVHNCAVGCSFCYINSGVRGYRGTGLITVPLNYGDQLKAQIAKMNRSAAGYFSSFTDPFTPLENYYHNTQQGAEAFVEQGLPVFFLSRLPYPKWAVEILKQNKYSYAQKSINTPSPEDWRLLSPGALSLQGHLEEIAMLRRNKIYVSIQCNPILPGITTHRQVCELFDKLKKAGANHVIVKVVEAGYSWAPEMIARNKKRFGLKRGTQFEKLFTQNIGGQKTVEEKYRLEGHRIYKDHATRIGLTYATCYEYRYESANADGKVSKTGISIGREFTTADQCHGQRVPIFTRDSSDEMFREVEECPPSGCLYCAKENDGEARCGDELMGQAPALVFKDLKQPIGQGIPRELVQLGVKLK